MLPRVAASLLLSVLIAPGSAVAQSAQQPTVTLPTIIVTAQKEPTNVRELPASVTAVTSDTILKADVRVVSDAAIYAPNTMLTEFTARKLSNARFRGIGSSPANPGVTTYIDGVPQLNTNSSNIELLDVDQIEFVRGPQSPLFGRNTLGGLITITSTKPSLSTWSGSLVAPFANYGSKEVRGGVSGPLGERVALGFSVGRQERDGYTVNDVTGHSLDTRSGMFAKAQVLWTPAQNWETRVIFTHERNRDGDYALGDLGAIRTNPFHASRNFEGFTNRDINGTTVLLRGDGERLAIRSSTGIVKWTTQDLTDLDYTALPLATRDNAESDLQVTEELRLASPPNAPVQLSDRMTLAWQSGLAFFKQNYDQDAVNNLAPFVLSPLVPFPVSQHLPESSIDGSGIGLFAQGTLTFDAKMDLTAGLRFDHESSQARISTIYSPALVAPEVVNAEDSYSDVSPQFSFAYRPRTEVMAYASAARGFKAGGFNPASPPGREAYGAEHAWHLEGGVKSSWAGGRVWANAALFYINWNDMQLNVPTSFAPGQFYIANVGRARSEGLELELTARPVPALDLFAAVGYTNARFADGSRSAGADVSNKKVPFTPDYTTTLGAQLTHALKASVSIVGRAEVVFTGGFNYDDQNTAGQVAYSLANLRGGVRGKFIFAEAWIRNAFDTRYVPIALPFGFAPSGFVGEMGRPRTFGISAGLTF